MGSSNKASRAAEQAEAQRKAEIAAANQRVNSIFDSPQRSADILDLETATRQFLQDDLDRKHKDTSRDLKFSLARSGLTHGSADVDLNSRLGDDYLRGILEADRRAKGAGTNLRTHDAETKAGLFSQILGGLDTTTAGQQAALALQQNVDLTKNNALSQGIGDMFGDYSGIFKDSKTAAADRRAAYDFNTLYGQRSKLTPSVAGSATLGG